VLDPANASADGRGQSSAPHQTVLIVDDDPGVTTTFARMLRLEGYEVATALTADAGLRQIDTDRPDAVLLDLRMPLVDGLDFLRELRARETERRTPVAIVTGDYALDDSTMRELGALGVEVYFKPVWFPDLIDIARRLIETPNRSPS
jgi:DNA-binding response OmpR family regulator